MSPQELRNCILISINREYYRWLIDLAALDDFQACISLPEKLTMEAYDVELALRFVLLHSLHMNDLPASGVALGEYLTKRMVVAAGAKTSIPRKSEKVFKETFSLLCEALESDSFRRYDAKKGRFSGGFSVAAFEVVALGIGAGLAAGGTWKPGEIVDLVKSEVWRDTSFLTSTGLAAASRLPTTLARGRSVFAK